MNLTDPRGGIPQPKPARAEATATEVVDEYLRHYQERFDEARRIAKRWTTQTVVITSSVTGVTAVIGAVNAMLANNLAANLLSVATTALSALATVMIARNNSARPRELWILRSAVLNRLISLRMRFDLDRASGTLDPVALQADLDAILRHYNDVWQQVHSGPSAP